MSDEMRILLMGYLDGELDEAQQRRVEEALERDPELKREYEEMLQLQQLTDPFGVDERTDAELEKFWGGVYNRLERRTAWLLMVSGFLMLVVVAAWFFFADPDTPMPIKAGVAIAGVGALILLWSVWRERCRSLPHDRYSNEVRR
jgi:anti-sigma factor RsiW